MATNIVAWHPLSHEDYGVMPGKDVSSRDGEKVGTIKEVRHPETEFPRSRGQHFFLLDPGVLRDWFGGFDKVYLPESAIDSVTEDRVVLNLIKDQIKQAGCTETPAGWDRYRAY